MKLQGKVAVVTGGNSGIGLAIAQEFTTQGAKVVIFGRNQETLDEAAKTIGNGTLAIRGDVTNLADLDRLYEQTVERFSNIDILVVNAGIANPVPVEQVTRRSSTEHPIPISKAPSLPYRGPFPISTMAHRSFS